MFKLFKFLFGFILGFGLIYVFMILVFLIFIGWLVGGSLGSFFRWLIG